MYLVNIYFLQLIKIYQKKNKNFLTLSTVMGLCPASPDYLRYEDGPGPQRVQVGHVTI